MTSLIYILGSLNSSEKDSVLKDLNISNGASISNMWLNESIELVTENEELNTSNYIKAKNTVFELAKEFYEKYENTPVCDAQFNFWTHLRVTAFLQLVTYYKIKNYIDYVSSKAEIGNVKLVNVPAVIFELLKLDYSVELFSVSENTNVSKPSFLVQSLKFFKSFLISKAKGFRPKKDTLLISTKVDFGTLITKDGLLQEDKFTFYIQEILPADSFDRLLNQNFFSKFHFFNNDGNSFPNKYNYIIEEVIVGGLFSFKILVNSFKNYLFAKNHLNSNKSVLDVLLKHNKSGFLFEYFFMNAFKVFLKKRAYKTIILSNEMSAIDNSIVRIAKELNIKTIGIQHGLINEYDLAYEFSDFELSKCNPFPDYFSVWGSSEKAFFDKNEKHFKNRIKTFGNVVFDGLKYLPKAEANKKLTLMFATQPQPIMKHRLQSLEDFVFAVNKFKVDEVEVIIRLHPREKDEINLYLPILKQLKNQNYELDFDKNLFLQLNKVDVLVTSFSTVAFDSMILKKQIVLLDYANQDLTGLINVGVAHKAIDSESLFDVLSQFTTKVNLEVSEVYKNQLKTVYDNLDFDVALKIKGLILD